MIPNRVAHLLLRGWHAWMAGAFFVAYLSGDEDSYALHLFAGYAALAAVAARLLASWAAPAGSPLRLQRPVLTGSRRNPLFAWLGAAVLVGAGLSALTGAIADPVHALEDLHEGLSEMALWPVLAHVGFILFIYGGRRALTRWFAAPAREPRP